jgi:hypothetical protein
VYVKINKIATYIVAQIWSPNVSHFIRVFERSNAINVFPSYGNRIERSSIYVVATKNQRVFARWYQKTSCLITNKWDIYFRKVLK